ncbi:nicotinate-nucleotide--dimethylbenzimidazole phosphoribosyltransferase [Oceaniserpentilla sp. 4NH20-0058]|uniref:nicotinate-nucleotide--dimethylbenzimidazole phosphoribosyltransferase n=1 Tax=Oceaniserpentilla sp. 4NH20-0058 TaxID=3127660 RepID=UPI003109E6E9
MSWYLENAKSIETELEVQAQQYQLTLTKPPGALGQLEHVAIRLAGCQGQLHPELSNIHISVFASDHGVAQQGVSAFPQAVTSEMVKNFAQGGAAITVLAKQLNAQFEVVNLGTIFPVDAHDQIVDARIGSGTKDFSQEKAMSQAELQQALLAGQSAALRAKQRESHLFIGGEMGIANTTSASALAAAYLNLPAIELVGPGTGLSADQLPKKAQIIEAAIELHQANNPIEILQCLGGFEIVGLVGAYIACAQQGTPVLVDGFISTAAALIAQAINPSIKPWLFYSHQSHEPGHIKLLAALNAQPLLNIGMRLGEGSGAAVVVSLMQSAVALHNEMATFAQAGVSESED